LGTHFLSDIERLAIGLSGDDLPPSLFGLFPEFYHLFFVKASLSRSDLEFDLRPYLDLRGQNFKIAIT